MARVLLIQPDRPFAKAVSKALKNDGYTVDWQTSAQKAIQSAELVAPDIVLLEIQLPQHSGVEFLYEFRSYEDWESTPVIILTTLSSTETGQSDAAWQQLGITEFLYAHNNTLQEIVISVKAALQGVNT